MRSRTLRVEAELDAEDQIIGLYQRHAAIWARRRNCAGFEFDWLDRFLSLCGQGAHVLDMGCGFGAPVAAHLMAQGAQVTGVDSSGPLIAMARERFPQGSWHVADMRGLALGHRFGGVLAWNSFFHLTHDDQRAMFATFAAHAAPGAGLMFTSGTSHGVAMGTLQDEPLYHASLDPLEYRELLSAHGFDLIAHKAEDPDCAGHTVWLARRLPEGAHP